MDESKALAVSAEGCGRRFRFLGNVKDGAREDHAEPVVTTISGVIGEKPGSEGSTDLAVRSDGDPNGTKPPNGIPAEFVVALDSGRPSGKGKSRTRIAGGDRKRSKDRTS